MHIFMKADYNTNLPFGTGKIMLNLTFSTNERIIDISIFLQTSIRI